MSDLTPISLGLFALGFLPAQALRSRRAAIVVAAAGLTVTCGILLAALTVARQAMADVDALSGTVIAIGALSLSYGVLSGGITRTGILSVQILSRWQRWLLTGLAIIVLALAGGASGVLV